MVRTWGVLSRGLIPGKKARESIYRPEETQAWTPDQEEKAIISLFSNERVGSKNKEKEIEEQP